MFQKILKYGIAIQTKPQSSSKIFYKSEIENKTKFQKILKYRIAIHAKSQSSRRNFYKSEIENQTMFWEILKYRTAIHAKSRTHRAIYEQNSCSYFYFLCSKSWKVSLHRAICEQSHEQLKPVLSPGC